MSVKSTAPDDIPLAQFLTTEPTENDLTQINPDDPNHGLSGTDKQLKIVKVAQENPELSAERVAQLLDTGRGYVGQVLRRADDTLWTDLFVSWQEVEEIEDIDRQENEYIARLNEEFDKVEIPEEVYNE